MLKTLILNLIPTSIWQKIQPYWHRIKYPMLIEVAQLTDQTIQFEASTLMEEYRIKDLGQEEEFIEMMLEDIVDSDVFFDIGGCVGLVALPAALRGSTVYSFEPDPGYRQRLNRNVDLNQLHQSVHIIDWAVSDDEGTVTLYTDGVNGRSPSLSEVGSRGATHVKTNSIDNAIDSGFLPSPSIIKLDIEGAEILALKGMQKLLNSKNKPRKIMCELHPELLIGFGSTVEECDQLLKDAGYRVTYSSERNKQIHRRYESR